MTDDEAASDDVWYVGYGSNVSPARFRTYLEGGVPPSGTHAERGSRDRRPATAIEALAIPHAAVFARGRTTPGGRWGVGGVAFLHPEPGSGTCRAVAYRITRRQFLDVLAQENGLADPPDDLVLPAPWRTTELPGSSWYRLVVGLEPIDGEPAVTFTHPDLEVGDTPPSTEYLRTIADGLREVHGMTDHEIAAALAERPGVGRTMAQLELALAR